MDYFYKFDGMAPGDESLLAFLLASVADKNAQPLTVRQLGFTDSPRRFCANLSRALTTGELGRLPQIAFTASAQDYAQSAAAAAEAQVDVSRQREWLARTDECVRILTTRSEPVGQAYWAALGTAVGLQATEQLLANALGQVIAKNPLVLGTVFLKKMWVITKPESSQRAVVAALLKVLAEGTSEQVKAFGALLTFSLGKTQARDLLADAFLQVVARQDQDLACAFGELMRAALGKDAHCEVFAPDVSQKADQRDLESTSVRSQMVRLALGPRLSLNVFANDVIHAVKQGDGTQAGAAVRLMDMGWGLDKSKAVLAAVLSQTVAQEDSRQTADFIKVIQPVLGPEASVQLFAQALTQAAVAGRQEEICALITQLQENLEPTTCEQVWSAAWAQVLVHAEPAVTAHLYQAMRRVLGLPVSAAARLAGLVQVEPVADEQVWAVALVKVVDESGAEQMQAFIEQMQSTLGSAASEQVWGAALALAAVNVNHDPDPARRLDKKIQAMGAETRERVWAAGLLRVVLTGDDAQARVFNRTLKAVFQEPGSEQIWAVACKDVQAQARPSQCDAFKAGMSLVLGLEARTRIQALQAGKGDGYKSVLDSMRIHRGSRVGTPAHHAQVPDARHTTPRAADTGVNSDVRNPTGHMPARHMR